MAVTINTEDCVGCAACVDECPQEILSIVDDVAVVANPDDCVDCGACVDACGSECISL